jgi:hypothetical protein
MQNEIEQMAKDFCAVGIPCEECHLYKNRCHAKKYATRAYNNGYRKASDVAREIFEEIEETLAHHYEEWDFCYYDDYLGEDIAELKKKYTESEKDDGKI